MIPAADSYCNPFALPAEDEINIIVIPADDSESDSARTTWSDIYIDTDSISIRSAPELGDKHPMDPESPFFNPFSSDDLLTRNYLHPESRSLSSFSTSTSSSESPSLDTLYTSTHLPQDIVLSLHLSPYIPTQVGFYHHESTSLQDPFFAHSSLAQHITDLLVDKFDVSLEPDSSILLALQPKLPLYTAQLVVITNLTYSTIQSSLSLLHTLHSTLSSSNKLNVLRGFSGHRIFTAALLLTTLTHVSYTSSITQNWSSITHFTVQELEAILYLFTSFLPTHIQVPYVQDPLRVLRGYIFYTEDSDEEEQQKARWRGEQRETTYFGLCSFEGLGVDVDIAKGKGKEKVEKAGTWGKNMGLSLRRFISV
ncbi:hypothetical protein BDQ17DRAFT_1373765 [Cyathus striatus]|nr:hypothetical protein BDQ17DRAFT_1373765 [Cyathus striatus]